MAVSSDGPTLPAAYIERAVELLGGHDVVLGPAEDGGYYPIGLRQYQPGLFLGVSWSTEHVTAQTRERARVLGLRLAQLPQRYDVDTPADLERVRADLGRIASPGRAPHAPFSGAPEGRRAGGWGRSRP